MSPEDYVGQGGYGDNEAQLTMLRSSFGDAAAYTMMGGNVAVGGAQQGFSRMMADMQKLGNMVRPVTYTPQARVITGFYGQQAQEYGFFSSMKSSLGVVGNNFGHSDLRAIEGGSEDFGARLAAGAYHGTAAVATTVGGFALSAPLGFVGRQAGGALLGRAGAAIGGGVGGLFGGFMLAGAAVDAVTEGVTARRGIQDYLAESSFRFAGAGSDMVDPVTGKGMSREARRGAADFLRKLDTSDPTLNTEELTAIMKGADQRGLFSNVTDIDQFKDKFKTVVETVKKVSKVLNQSLEEGLNTMKELKGIGIQGNDVSNAITLSATHGAVAGRTATEMIGLGMQGAEMFRGTGIEMSVGFASSQMNLSAIRAAKDAKLLSTETVAQAGGEEALAMRMTATGLQYSQTAAGRGFGAGFFDTRSHGLDKGALMKSLLGGSDFMGAWNRSAQKLSSPGDLISYQTNQEQFLSDVGKQFGGDGMQVMQDLQAGMMAEMYARDLGINKEDAFEYVLQQQGVSRPEIEARKAKRLNAKKHFKAQVAGAERTRQERMVEEARSNNDLIQLTENIGDRFTRAADVLASPVNRAMDNFVHSYQVAVEENVYGIRRASFQGVDRDTLARGADILKKSSNLGKQPADNTPQEINLDKGGLVSTTQGEAIQALLKSGNLGELGKNILDTSKKAGGNVTLVKEWRDEYSTRISEDQLRTIDKESNRIHTAIVDASSMKITKEVTDSISKSVNEGLVSGKINEKMNLAEVVKAVTGKDISKASDQEIAAIYTKIKDVGGVGDKVNESVGMIASGTGALNAKDVESMRRAQESFESQKKVLGDVSGLGDVASGVFEKITAARAAYTKYKETGSQEAKAEYEKYASEAISSQANTSGDKVSDVSNNIRKVVTGEGLNANQAKTINQDFFAKAAATAVDMNKIQDARSSSALGKMLDLELRGAGLGDDSKLRAATDAITTGDQSSRLKSLLTLDDKTAEKLSGLGGVGTLVADSSKTLKSIEKAKSKEEVSKILETSTISKEDRLAVVENWNEHSSKMAVNTAFKSLSNTFASETAMSAASPAGKVGTSEGTSTADYAKTVAVQAQTLVAMEALTKLLMNMKVK